MTGQKVRRFGIVRHSMAWLRTGMSLLLKGQRLARLPTRSCHLSKSVSVTNSVTGCSTCKRVFISIK